MSVVCWKHCPCFTPNSNDFDGEDCKQLDYSHLNLLEVPDEIFNVERTLEELILDSNIIKDLPRNLFHCIGLKKLSIADNDIQTLPAAISSLVNLEELNLSRNGIPKIPDGIKCCKCLKLIDCSVNPLCKLPDGFSQLINLTELNLNDTFMEYLPANFGRLSRLKVVELRENSIKTLPKSIARLTQLKRFDIGQNEFIEIPECLCNLPKLEELWCDGNEIVNIPSYIGKLSQLSYLDANENNIETVALEIGDCVRLTDLNLNFNKIIQLPETFGNLKNLTTLQLADNRLMCLPNSIGNLSSLQELVISNNCISALPASIGFLRNIHTLIADSNQIQEIPASIGSCVKLTLLSLAFNQLTFLPEEIGRLNQLKMLNLRANKLKYLPFTLANITNLRSLWLSENQQKPIMKLQTDIDEESGAKTLTCFLLPQQTTFANQNYSNDNFVHHKSSKIGHTRESKIKFSSHDQEIPEKYENFSSKLIRNPTSYPKELKAHARHARNLALKNKDSNYESEDRIQLENGQEKENEVCELTKGAKTIATTKANNKDGYVEAVETQHKVNCLSIKEAKVAKATIDELDHYDMEMACQDSELTQNQENKSDLTSNKQYSSPLKDETQCNQISNENQGINIVQDLPKTNHESEKKIEDSVKDDSILIHTSPMIDINHSSNEKLSFSHLTSSSKNDKCQNFSSTQTLKACSSSLLNYPKHYDQLNICHHYSEVHDTSSTIPSSPVQLEKLNKSSYIPPLINSNDEISPLPAKNELKPYLPTRTSSGPRNKLISAPSQVIIQKFSMGIDNYCQLTPDFKDSSDNLNCNETKSNIKYNSQLNCTSSIEPYAKYLQEPNANIFPVIIVKNPGIGFTIEGGIDSQKTVGDTYDTNIYVQEVVENGPASTALHKGDIIFQANGVEFTFITKDQAMNILQSAGNTLSLMISRNCLKSE